MKMGRIEKRFMNTSHHNAYVIGRAEDLLCHLDKEAGQHVLEVGCGNGAVSKHIAHAYGFTVTGIDVDPDQILKAQNQPEDQGHVVFMEADATCLPFPDMAFDIVLSFGVMHHIRNWPVAICELKRILKSCGYFVYWDIVYPTFVAKIASLFPHPYGITTLQALRQNIEKNGFDTIHMRISRMHQVEAIYKKR
jgi:ubiquinone/menaquinone biosynthesis C-methylase UbiE